MSKKVTDLPAGVADAATFYAVSAGNDTQVLGGFANGVATLDGDTKVPNAQLHLGENGGPAGPLDANGHLPSGQVPPMPRELGGEVATEADMLALNVAAPAECIRTDFTPPHIFYLAADPATDVSNWHDLGPLSAGAANPTAKVGLTPTNGVASTFMRSDASPAIDESILAVKRTSGNKQLELNGDELIWPNDIVNGKVRLWNTTPGSNNTYYGFGIQNGTLVYQVDSNTSKHVFQGVDGYDNELPIAELSHDGGIVARVDTKLESANPIFELQNTGSAADEGRWQWSTDPDQLSLTALSDDGNTVGTAWLITRSGANVTAHSIQAGGNPLLEISSASDIVANVDLHMSEKKVINMGDPSDARDGVNLQTLDGRLSAAQRTAINALAVIANPSTATAEEVANKLNDIINALKAT